MKRRTLGASLHELIRSGVTIQTIMEVTKVRAVSVGEWLADVRQPSGETFVRLLWLTWSHDIHPDGHVPDETMMGLAGIISCNILTPIELGRLLGYVVETDDTNGAKGIYDYILGRRGMFDNKMVKANALLAKYQDRIRRQQSGINPGLTRPESKINYIVHLINQLSEALQKLLESDDASERKELRRIMLRYGADALFIASNRLSAVCSENARKLTSDK